MFRSVVLFALLASPSAFACGGKSCGESCAMASHSDKAAADDVDAAAGEKVQLAVTGMHCGACASKITAALKGVDGVNAAAVDHETGTAKIAFDAEKTNVEALVAAVAKLGKFEATAPAAEG